MSAVAFAEGGADVVTLEFDEAIASTARQVFKDCHLDDKITLIQGPAKEAMETLKTKGHCMIDNSAQVYLIRSLKSCYLVQIIATSRNNTDDLLIVFGKLKVV